jgi:hypothetical protein
MLFFLQQMDLGITLAISGDDMIMRQIQKARKRAYKHAFFTLNPDTFSLCVAAIT